MLADLRFAIRTFARTPGFVVMAVLVLALGIGANTAIFSVVNAALLHALPYRNPDQLVMIWEKNPQLGDFLAERTPVCLKNFLQWKHQTQSFSQMGVFESATFTLTGADKPEQIEAALASADLPDVFGVKPFLGRMFTAEEKDRVIVISHALFVRRFGADPKTLGRSMSLSGNQYTVIGVWPAEFHLPAMWQGFDQKKPDLWLPLDLHPNQPQQQLEARTKFVFARLRPGAGLAQARAEMDVIGKRLEAENPNLNTGFGVNVFPLSEEDVGPKMRRYVLILQGAVGFVLLIACANVANLLLARSIGRRKELAVRLALGGTRSRLIRQMLSESLLLSFAGGAVGLLLAVWGMKAITALAPDGTQHMDELRLDSVTLGFTILIVMITGIIFGLAPALDAARRNVNEALSQGGRSGSAGISTRLRSLLVVGEVALALVLLLGAGLLIRTVRAMLTADPGFRRDSLLTMRLALPPSKYPKPEQAAVFCRELLDRVSALPGVNSVSLASGLPMQGFSLTSYEIEGAPPLSAASTHPITSYRTVSEEYFRTMGLTIVRGRSFTRQEADDPQSSSMLINETLTKKVWPNQDPLGKALHIRDQRRVVIGVVADARQLGPESEISPEVYLPSRRFTSMTLVVRTVGDPSRLTTAVSRAIWAIDKDQPISQIHTMDETIREWVSERRFVMLLLSTFAGLALLLAAIGIYGVLAYSVSQRTREIGIRMALGASAGDVLRLVVGDGLMLTAIGVAVGLAGAFALTRVMQGLIFGVSATDPGTFALGVAVLAIASLLAGYIPARRAAALAPLDALREE